MSTISPCWRALPGIWLSALLFVVLAATSVQAQTQAYGLASEYGEEETLLVAFELSQPGPVTYKKVTFNQPVTGVASGQFLVGLDARPVTGASAALGDQLFALGYDASRQEAQLYQLSPVTAAATMVGPVQKVNLGANRARIGFDFYSLNMIRVTGSNGTALFFSSDDGLKLLTDAGSSLAYAAADPNAGRQPLVGSSAYINDQTYPAARLYHLDEATSERLALAVQPTTTAGILSTVQVIDGSISPSSSADLDIYTDPVSGANTGYMSISDPDYANFETKIYTLDLATGTPTLIGRVTTGSRALVTDIALAIRPTNLATGTHKPALVIGFNLFPNPVLDRAELSFHLPHAGAAELVLTDILGNIIDRQNLGSIAAGTHKLTWSPLSKRPGVYFLRLLLNGQPAGTQRLVMQ